MDFRTNGISLLLFFWAAVGTAQAEGFGQYDYGARGTALNGAVMARKADASATAYNAAQLARLPGTRVMLGASTLATSGHISWEQSGQQGRTDSVAAVWILPHAYYTQQINDSWFWSLGIFSRFGTGVEYPADWPGRFNIYDTSLLTSSLNPILAWKATDKLSLALGPEFVYATLDMKSRIAVPVPGAVFEVDSHIRKADDWGLGFNLAAHYQFDEQWSAGLQYRSRVRIKAEGEARFTYQGPSSPPLEVIFGQAFKNGSAQTTITLPDSLAGGLAFSPSPALSFEVGAVWIRWSSYEDLDIKLPEGMPESHNPKDWKDVWRFVVGVEYEALDWLTLRAGYAWNESPMTNRYADYTAPTDGRHNYSLGLGFHNEQWSLDLAYAYIQCQSRAYSESPALGGTGVLNSTSHSRAHVTSASIGYQF